MPRSFDAGVVVALALGFAGASAVACSFTSLDGLTCSGGGCLDDAAGDGGAAQGDGSVTDGTVESAPAPPIDPLGDGHWGSKRVSAQETVNAYSPLAGDVAAGASAIDLALAGPFATGDLVLVWQTTSDEPFAGVGPKLDLAPSRVGLYEIARVTKLVPSGAGAHLELSAPLGHAFVAAGAQVVRIAEYTDLTVDPGGIVAADAWNGLAGGIVAVLVRGLLKVDGAIVADGVGSRGGVTYTNAGPYNCGTSDGLLKDGYAARGEGIVRSAFVATSGTGMAMGGRPNTTTGGGGGTCHNAGAGGGGNGSAGGQGGHDYDGSGVGRDVGGLGGLAMTFSVRDRLVLGGGGGSGDRHAEVDTTGARGGGVLFVRAHDLLASGAIRADGAIGGPTNHDGAPGGGAGGTISLTVVGAGTCSSPIQANGGAGGSTTMSNVGPGGGGGGGHVMVKAGSGSCTAAAQSGLAGDQANPGALSGKHYGAAPAVAVAGVIEAP